MCGIAGVVADERRRFPLSALTTMRSALTHRGPDGSGLFHPELHGASDGVGYGLVHTRLKILDLTECAAQPMTDESAKVHLTFNGEIYNYLELRSTLRELGHAFSSSGDTQVLLAAYKEWGANCVDHLVGMYSFAVVDLDRGILFAARDPFGIKPFYYARVEHGWAFASEIKAIRALPGSPGHANMGAVLRYLRYGGTDGSEAPMFDGIYQIPPGHHMTMQLASPQPHIAKYFDLAISPMSEGDISLDEAADTLHTIMQESVRLHLQGDVRVGAALSGGLDSSTIVSLSTPLTPNDNDCFTDSAAGSSLDEVQWARQVAESRQASLHTTSPSVADLIRELRDVTRSLDEPLASTSLYAQYCVFRLAKQNDVTVLLHGRGADEMLAGYDPYLVGPSCQPRATR